MSDDHTEVKIREIAYRLWEEAGQPVGRDDEFWHRAKEQVEGSHGQGQPDTADSFPASDPPSNSGMVGPKT